MKNIAIFGSGAGTNAENIIEYFKKKKTVKVSLIICNNREAGILKVASRNDIPSIVFSRNDFFGTDKLPSILKRNKIDLVVLAGFLWMIPEILLKEYPDKIINIHPSLLPEFGGKGMYGMKVHKAVHTEGKKQSGISIHKVNEKYDEGEIIFQQTCEIDREDTPETIAAKVQELEYRYFPEVIEKFLLKV